MPSNAANNVIDIINELRPTLLNRSQLLPMQSSRWFLVQSSVLLTVQLFMCFLPWEAACGKFWSILAFLIAQIPIILFWRSICLKSFHLSFKDSIADVAFGAQWIRLHEALQSQQITLTPEIEDEVRDLLNNELQDSDRLKHIAPWIFSGRTLAFTMGFFIVAFESLFVVVDQPISSVVVWILAFGYTMVAWGAVTVLRHLLSKRYAEIESLSQMWSRIRHARRQARRDQRGLSALEP